MKKILSFFLLISILFSLSGCVSIWLYENGNKEFSSENVEKIEIYDLPELGDGLTLKYSVPKSEMSIDRLDELYSPACTVPPEKHAALIKDLNRLSFKYTDVTVLSADDPEKKTYRGNILKITYASGEYDIVSAEAQLYCTKDGTREYENTCSYLFWNAFILGYMGTDSADS